MGIHDQAIADFNARAKAEHWVQYCDPMNAFVLRECEELAALWERARGNKPMPTRSDLSPKMLKPYLPRLAMVERIENDPPKFKFKVVGTITTLTLDERTGQGFDHETASPEQTARWTHCALLLFQVGKPLRFPICTERSIIGETVSMPLADETGEPRFVLAFGKYEPTRDWSKREEPLAQAS